MESKVTVNNKDSEEVWTEKTLIAKTPPHSDKKKRRATDFCWCGLFLIFLAIWTLSWIHAIYDEDHYQFFLDEKKRLEHYKNDKRITAGYISKSGKNDTEIVYRYNDIVITRSDCNYMEWKMNKHFTLLEYLSLFYDSITLNPSNKDAHYKAFMPCKEFAQFNNVVISLYAFRYAIKPLCGKFLPIGLVFLYSMLIERLSMIFYSDDLMTSSWFPYHKKLVYWVIPDILLVIVLISNQFIMFASSEENLQKKSDSVDNSAKNSLRHDDAKQDSNNQSENGSGDSNNSSNVESELYKASLSSFAYVFIIGFPLTIILKILFTVTINVTTTLSWADPHLYYMSIGSCYVGLTIYYFGLITTACGTDMLIENKKFKWRDVLRALYITARYHFGTACFLATMISPRTRAVKIMGESEFQNLKEASSTKRAHRQVYSLCPTLTGMRGLDYSESMKESLRRFDFITSNKKYFLDHHLLWLLILLVFLLSWNDLTLTMLWFFGADDPQFSKATYAMYFRIIFTFSILPPFIWVVVRVIGFRLCETKGNSEEPLSEVSSK